MDIQTMYKDVRLLTRANECDYTDEEICCHLQNEYKLLQELLNHEGKVEYTQSNSPLSYTVAGGTTFFNTDPNLHIQRIEVSTAGEDKWCSPTQTTYQEYGDFSSNCCGCDCNSLSAAMDGDGCVCECDKYYIQTSDGIHIFPNNDGTDVRIWTRGTDELDCNDPNYVPKIPAFAHRLMTLKAALMFRDIENTNELDFLLSEYNNLFALFNKHIKSGGKIIQMRNKPLTCSKGGYYPRVGNC